MKTSTVLRSAIAACCLSLAAPAGSVKAPHPGQRAPEFRLLDSRGKRLALSAYKGKVVLLNFWATWCHGCQLEIPWFMEFESTYRDHGLAVIGVSMDSDGWKSVKPYLAKKKLNYPVVIGSEQLANRYGLDAMPMTVLIDRAGKIVQTHSGVVDKAACEHEIVELLAK